MVAGSWATGQLADTSSWNEKNSCYPLCCTAVVNDVEVLFRTSEMIPGQDPWILNLSR
jgi:hypothetical protein